MTKKDNLRITVGRLTVLLVVLVFIVASCAKKTPKQQESSKNGQQKNAQKQDSPKQAPSGKETAGAPAGKESMVPIDIKLPARVFEGTPEPANVPNLEKPLGKDRPPFLAPAGTKNVALGKPVTSSDPEPIIGELEIVTDGDKEAADGSFVELGPFKQHVTIDLGTECEIYAIVVWHYHMQARVYFDVIVQVSNDPEFVNGVVTVFNNDIDNSSGMGIGKDKHYVETNEGKLIDCISQGPVKGRYVRLYSNGNSTDQQNHYTEVEVYGKPVK